MANTFKKTMKKFGRYVWELFKVSLPTGLMYCCAGTILLMLTMKESAVEWNNQSLLWTIVCVVGGAGYNALMAWANGGMHYEMLVSGNVKRMSAEQFEGGYKMSSHKEAKEYRVWKGFAIGAFIAILPLFFGIFCGVNQEAIHTKEMNNGIAILLLAGFLLSGWSVVPFYLMNTSGIAVSYFWSCLFAIIPIAVMGGFYIAGAYAKRGKRIREQIIAQKQEEAEANRVKKINYGGLPGTKPKKRKK